jgi:hypothetical protein
VWMEDWKALIKQYGIDRFKAGLHAAILHLKFFPKPGDIVERMPPARQDDSAVREMAALKKRRDEHPEEFMSAAMLESIKAEL